MKRLALWIVLVTACSAPSPPHAVAAWEPIDPAFAGCQGSCGAHADHAIDGVVAQPAAAIGDRTYCPVSGAVFTIDAEHPHTVVGDRTIYFCCAACAAYFEANRDAIVASRGLGG
jgi:hypothetical protein